ncbi:MAG TPA: Ig-like domain-containing protein [Vicinamibacterales bacterium]|nr:Ig-like domain-containing protein [Vicinamibacterales bacterium]
MHRMPTSRSSSRSNWFRRAVLGIVIPLVTLSLTACGSESSPSAPSSTTPAAPAAPTVSALRIDGANALRAGLSSDYTATVTLSNGTTQAVTPTWSSGNSSVATVDGNGRVSAQSPGQATLTAAYQGASTTKNVSVVANFAGQWSGRYAMKACDQSGVFTAIGYCQGLGPVGSTGPITLSLTQGGNDQSDLSGTIAFGALAGGVSGNVTADGRMVIGGSFNVVASGVTFSFRVGGWESRLTGPSTMTGRWADNLTAVGIPGNAYTENELQTMTRTSSAAAPAAPARTATLKWADLFASMRQPQMR